VAKINRGSRSDMKAERVPEVQAVAAELLRVGCAGPETKCLSS
jgi:hypothetical protein